MYSEVGLLDHTVVLFLSFSGTFMLSPWWLYQFTFLPKVYKSSIFSTSPPILFILCLLDDSQPNRYFIVILICISPIMISEHLFIYYWPYVCILWKNIYLKILPICNWMGFCYWIVWASYRFWILIFFQMYGLQIFSPNHSYLLILMIFCFFFFFLAEAF